MKAIENERACLFCVMVSSRTG